MKVLHVYQTYLPENNTGIPRVIYEICSGLSARSIEPYVLTTAKNTSESPYQVAGGSVYAAKRNLRLFSTNFSLELFRLHKDLTQEVDVIHYHYPWPAMDMLHLFNNPRKPTVLTYHSDIIKQKHFMPLYRPLLSAFFRQIDHIVATSENYVETSPILKRYADKVSVIPINLPEREQPSSEVMAKWRARLGEDFFLFIGAPRYYKGLAYLFEAARISGLKVVFAGAGDWQENGAREQSANIIHLGEVSEVDKEALLELCYAFVLPSHLRSEAFGIVLLEAARAGKPMISCEIGTGTSYVNLDKVTGLVVPPANADALAEAMKRLAGDRDLASTFGRAARKRFAADFGASLMVDSYVRLYERLVGAPTQ